MKNHRRSTNGNRKATCTKRLRYRPSLENLECRITPATITWDNGGDAFSWSDPLNWDTDTVPGAADTAVIDSAALVELNGAAAIQSLQVSNSMFYINGSLSVSANSSSSGYIYLNGSLDVQPGVTFDFTNGGSIAGVITVDATSNVNFATNWFEFVTGASLSGPGWYHINGATATISGNVSVANMSLNNLGLLEGMGTLTVTDTFNWQSGGMYGSGALEIAAGATMNITGAAPKTSDWTIENAGTINWTGGDIAAAATINNNVGALFDIQTDALLGDYNPFGVLNNSGTLRKSAGAGTTSLGLAVNNDGLLDIQTGTVEVIGPFNQNTGNIDLAPNTGLNLQAGATLNGTADAGAGAVLSLSGFDSFDIGTFSFTGDGTMVHGTDEWGQTTLSGLATISNFQFDAGTIYGAGTINATDTFAWNGGTMQGGGTTEIAVAATMTINGNGNTLNTWTIDNYGTINWTAGDLTADMATINNKAGGLFDIQGDVTLANAMQDSVLTNDGTLRKSAGAGTATVELETNSVGSIDVQSGIVQLNGGGNLDGPITAAMTAQLQVGVGEIAFLGNMTFSGDGFLYQIAGSAVVFGSVPVTNFTLNGTLQGPGRLQATQTFNWMNASRIQNQGVEIALGGTMNVTGDGHKIVEFGELVNYGTINWTTGAGSLGIGGFARFENHGNFVVNAVNHTAYVSSIPGNNATIENFGVIRLTGAQGAEISISTVMHHGSASIHVDGGRMQFDLSTGSFYGPIETQTGTDVVFSKSIGTGLYAFNPNMDDGPSDVLRGSGWFRFIDGAVIDIPQFDFVQASNLELSDYQSGGGMDAAILQGLGTLSVNHFKWLGGKLQTDANAQTAPQGILEIPSGGQMEIVGDHKVTLSDRTIINNGTIHWGPGVDDSVEIDVTDGGNFVNDGGTFEISNNSIMRFVNGGGTLEVKNAGIIRKNTAPVGIDTVISIPTINNGGTISVEGDLVLYELTNNSGTTRVTSGKTLTIPAPHKLVITGGIVEVETNAEIKGHRDEFLEVSGGTLNLTYGQVTSEAGATQAIFIGQNGVLSGAGTVNGRVRNDGTLRVGGANAVGLITINGDYIQSQIGSLDLEISGTQPGTFDRLAISGEASMRGTLNVDWLAFNPDDQDVFDIITFASRDQSQFDTLNLDAFWTIEYLNDKIRYQKGS